MNQREAKIRALAIAGTVLQELAVTGELDGIDEEDVDFEDNEKVRRELDRLGERLQIRADRLLARTSGKV